MEPLTAGAIAIAIGAVIATKAVEKTGEKVGETLWNKTGELLVTLKKHSPDTVVAIEKAPSQPLDYGKAVLEVESAAKANPEVYQAVQELVAAAKADRTYATGTITLSFAHSLSGRGELMAGWERFQKNCGSSKGNTV